MRILIDIPDDDEEKAALLDILSQEDTLVLSQAFVYIKNLEWFGVDVTERWATTVEQSYALTQAYKQGKYDQIQEFKQMLEDLGIDFEEKTES